MEEIGLNLKPKCFRLFLYVSALILKRFMKAITNPTNIFIIVSKDDTAAEEL
jgi:hypothetical protein